jgi:hypothetical protein
MKALLPAWLAALLLTGCLQVVGQSLPPPPTGEDAGQPQKPGTSSTRFCADYAAAYCDFSKRCGLSTRDSGTECLTFTEGGCVGTTASATLGYVTFNPSRAATCLESMQADSCVTPLGCVGVFRGAVDTGGACLAPSDCKNATDSCVGSGCTKTCRTVGAVGEQCRQDLTCDLGLWCDRKTTTCKLPTPPVNLGERCWQTAECKAGAYCELKTLTCTVRPAAGAACVPISKSPVPPCVESAWCNVNVCETKRAEGVACPDSESCQSNLYCDVTCKPRRALGGTCSNAGQCVDGLRCTGGVCSPPKSAGQTCSSTDECSTGLGCDTVLRTCERATYSLTVGDRCTNSLLNCESYLGCRGLSEQADGGSVAGTCAELAMGEVCDATGYSECPMIAFCKRDGGAPQGLCAPLSEQPCRMNALGVCATEGPPLPAGEQCGAQADCQAHLRCLPQNYGGPRCTRLGDVGDPCAISKVVDQSCLFPLECTNGTCQHAGAIDEPCLRGFGCISGACRLDTGVCGPKLNEGSACSGNASCLSGYCVYGKCTSVCR